MHQHGLIIIMGIEVDNDKKSIHLGYYEMNNCKHISAEDTNFHNLNTIKVCYCVTKLLCFL